MPAVAYFHEKEPRDEILDQFKGFDFSSIEPTRDNRVLCAVYIAPQKMASGLLRPDQNRDEDKYQGKVGLILKKGPTAFVDSGDWTFSIKPDVGDWVYYKPSDTWA